MGGGPDPLGVRLKLCFRIQDKKDFRLIKKNQLKTFENDQCFVLNNGCQQKIQNMVISFYKESVKTPLVWHSSPVLNTKTQLFVDAFGV